ncbi:hypothetical protein D3P07_25775 [Paenibacillus sp. 1011MAR3C5]|uniref:hypothetical protein n=1 Tax=Paenibacillus sp. 1011MAR3C5 TaxID=1675787 RepID=UPI000E6C53B7|nr:hypothetical protein [Paenibacillus sp. 1011MAR3C5]RJE83043.1 hypothetical protein D3P07_25775 [Paenibacillus sp. 1011MAR3C5]
MKTISLKLLVLIMLIVLAVISIWLERKADDGAASGAIGDQVIVVTDMEELSELWLSSDGTVSPLSEIQLEGFD